MRPLFDTNPFTLPPTTFPLAKPLDYVPGARQQLTPSIDAIVTPNIDECLDEEDAKRAFWSAFRVLGEWYADLPPY